jgi:hypothetical protein
MELANIIEPVILIKSKLAVKHFNNLRLRYEYTRGCWAISKERADKSKYVFLVSDSKDGYSKILEVYRVKEWFIADGSIFTERDDMHLEKYENRVEFIGNTVKETIRDKYIGKYVAFVGSNPIKYINI